MHIHYFDLTLMVIRVVYLMIMGLISTRLFVIGGVLARLRVFPHFQTFSIPYWLDFRRPKEKTVVVVFRR